MLPWGMEFNLEVVKDKIARISYPLGVDISNMSIEEKATAAINAVRQLSKDIGLPQKLHEVGVEREDLKIMAENAMLDWCHPANPRKCTEEDMYRLYANAFE